MKPMMGDQLLGSIRFLANGVGILILRKSALKNLNVKSAFSHVAGDTISSGGVIVGSLVIIYTGWHTIDSIIGIFIGLLILRGGLWPGERINYLRTDWRGQ